MIWKQHGSPPALLHPPKQPHSSRLLFHILPGSLPHPCPGYIWSQTCLFSQVNLSPFLEHIDSFGSLSIIISNYRSYNACPGIAGRSLERAI